ncbi:MAG TPA: DUF5985 family protein [Vicinamibacterales bacterium]
MAEFFYGAATMGCAVVGLFFLRFWRASFDRLFLMFALAFWILAINYAVLGVARTSEWRVPVFTLRLLAFSLLIYAIVHKNRRA